MSHFEHLAKEKSMGEVKCKGCGQVYAFLTDKNIDDFCILCRFNRSKNAKKSDEIEQLTLF